MQSGDEGGLYKGRGGQKFFVANIERAQIFFDKHKNMFKIGLADKI